MTPNDLPPTESGTPSAALHIEITCHGLNGTDEIIELVHQKSTPLGRFQDQIQRCSIVIERPRRPDPNQNPHYVQLNLTLSSGVVLTVIEDRENHDAHEPLSKILADAFRAAEHRLKEIIAHDESGLLIKGSSPLSKAMKW